MRDLPPFQPDEAAALTPRIVPMDPDDEDHWDSESVHDVDLPGGWLLRLIHDSPLAMGYGDSWFAFLSVVASWHGYACRKGRVQLEMWEGESLEAVLDQVRRQLCEDGLNLDRCVDQYRVRVKTAEALVDAHGPRAVVKGSLIDTYGDKLELERLDLQAYEMLVAVLRLESDATREAAAMLAPTWSGTGADLVAAIKATEL